MKHIVKNAGCENDFEIASKAANNDALGCDMHKGSKEMLHSHGVPFEKREAKKMSTRDYDYYDALIAMDDENLFYMKQIAGGDAQGKMHKLLEYAGLSRDVRDPWYTHNFSETWDDINAGCLALFEKLK